MCILHNHNLLLYYVYKLLLFVLHMCNITLPHRQGSRPDGARYVKNLHISDHPPYIHEGTNR